MISFSENIHARAGIESVKFYKGALNTKNDTVQPAKTASKIDLELFNGFTNLEKSRTLELAYNSVSNNNFTIQGTKEELLSKRKNINEHWIAIHEKFVMGYACVLMFFIGAPLGAIIRKGGLGLPIVFAVLIFITFHFTNTFGKKIAQEDGLTPFLGVWMSSFILTPFALLLTYRATNDIGLINMDAILLPIQNFFKKLFTTTKNKDNVN